MVPLVLGFKNGSREGMVITILGIQLFYFTSLMDVKYAPNFTGFMQYLRLSTFELDSVPNIYKDVFINQGGNTEQLLRTDEKNFYIIGNMIEFNWMKLLFLFIFNII